MPHAAQRLVDVLHNLRRRLGPPELEQLLPNVTGVPVDDRLRDPSEQFVHHDGLVIFGNRVKRLLDDMAAKWVHGEVQSVAPNRLGNLDHLLRCSMFEAALDQEIAEAVDHQGISLGNDGFNDLVLLFRSANLEFLLEEDGGLLVVVTDNLVDNILPVAIDIAIQQTAVVEGLGGWKVGLALGGNGLVRDTVSRSLCLYLTMHG